MPTMGASTILSSVLLALTATANAYWLMGAGAITKERMDPLISPGEVAHHTHIVYGGSNFGVSVNTEKLQKSECSSVPIVEDKSAYWAPLLYFQWANGSFSSLDGGAVIYYLFPNKPGSTKAFPKDFRMISGDPTLRTYDGSNHGQQAVTFLCLDFKGTTSEHNSLPEKHCPSGIRSQINFPSCWDGKNVDSPDHRSHVAYRSKGPDDGECTDPKYPVNIPRVFLEIYWDTGAFDSYRSQAKNPNQPFVFAYGDETGFGNHADLYNGWDDGVLQRAIDGCTCNDSGDPTCCGQTGKKLFTLKEKHQCRITPGIDERTTGMLNKLPGNNPVQPAGRRATMLKDSVIPALISPVYAYTGNSPTATGSPVGGPKTVNPENPQPTSPAPATSNPTPTSSANTPSNTGKPIASPSPSPPASSAVPSSPATNVPNKPAPTAAPTNSSPASSSAAGTVTRSSTAHSGPHVTLPVVAPGPAPAPTDAPKPVSTRVCRRPRKKNTLPVEKPSPKAIHGRRHYGRNSHARYEY